MLTIGQPGARGHGDSSSLLYVYCFSEFTIIFQIKILISQSPHSLRLQEDWGRIMSPHTGMKTMFKHFTQHVLKHR